MTEVDILKILAGPFALVAVGLGAGWGLGRGDDEEVPAWILPVAVALGYVLGHVCIASFPSYPAATADEWLVFVALIAGGWGGVEAWFGEPKRAWVYNGRVVIVGAALWVMFGDALGLGTVLPLMAGVLIWVAAMGSLARRMTAVAPLWIVGCASAALGGILLMGASLKLAILAWGVMACAVAAAGMMTVIGVFGEGKLDVWPVWLVVGLVWASLAINGVTFAQASIGPIVGVWVGLTGAIGVGAILSMRGLESWIAGGIAGIVALIATAGAAGYEYYEEQRVDEEVDDETGGEYGDPYTW